MSQNVQVLFKRLVDARWGDEKPTKADFVAAGMATMTKKDINYWWKIFADLDQEMHSNLSEEDQASRLITLQNEKTTLQSQMGLTA